MNKNFKKLSLYARQELKKLNLSQAGAVYFYSTHNFCASTSSELNISLKLILIKYIIAKIVNIIITSRNIRGKICIQKLLYNYELVKGQKQENVSL